MKKTTSNRWICLVLAAALGLLCSCSYGGLQKSDAIHGQALLSGATLEFPVKNMTNPGNFAAYEIWSFTCDWPQEKIQKKLEKAVGELEGVQMTYLGETVYDGVLFHADNGDETADDYYLVGADGIFGDLDENERGYVFTGMAAKFADIGKETNADGEDLSKSLLIPQHLMAGGIQTHDAPFMYNGTLYETLGGVDEFAAFYEASGWYTFDVYGPRIVLRGYAKEPANKDIGVDFDLPFPIIIDFSETDAGQFVNYWRYLTLEECLAFSDLELAENLAAVKLTEENGAYYSAPDSYEAWKPAPQGRGTIFPDSTFSHAPYGEGSEEKIEEIALFMFKRYIQFYMNTTSNTDSTFLITAYKDLSVTVYSEEELPDGYAVQRDFTVSPDDPPMTFWYVAPSGSYRFIGEIEGVGSGDDLGADEWAADFGKENEIFLSIMLYKNTYSMSTCTWESTPD